MAKVIYDIWFAEKYHNHCGKVWATDPNEAIKIFCGDNYEADKHLYYATTAYPFNLNKGTA